MLSELIKKLMDRQNLTEAECYDMIAHILRGENIEQISAALVLLRSKGETPTELAAIVNAMKAHTNKLELNTPLLDIVGTGGDNANTVNISTAAALVTASLGVKVAKHGNRSVSSKCGSADIIEALKIPIALNEKEAYEHLNAENFTFLYGPHFHPAMKKIKSIRKNLKVRTTFNLIGPLLNPAQPSNIIIGVFERKLIDILADVVQKLNFKHTLIVHGNGLDEISCLGPIAAIEVTPTDKKYLELDPKHYGLPYCQLKDLQGGEPATNLALLLAIFNGEKNALADTLAFHVGIALHFFDKKTSIEEGIQMAEKALQTGIVLKFIEGLCHA